MPAHIRPMWWGGLFKTTTCCGCQDQIVIKLSHEIIQHGGAVFGGQRGTIYENTGRQTKGQKAWGPFPKEMPRWKSFIYPMTNGRETKTDDMHLLWDREQLGLRATLSSKRSGQSKRICKEGLSSNLATACWGIRRFCIRHQLLYDRRRLVLKGAVTTPFSVKKAVTY